jgi:hypothetical protein
MYWLAIIGVDGSPTISISEVNDTLPKSPIIDSVLSRNKTSNVI